jgi:succinylglutamate desuccinylase
MEPVLTELRLNQLEYIPEGLLSAAPEALHRLLSGPTLIHLSGKRSTPLFISVLLHGNEPTGFFALQALLKKYQQKELPRSVSIFFGNTLAAEQKVRRLEDQPDFNRVWPGTEFSECPETRLTREVFEIMKKRGVFASIDIHNNTGLNPHYACINNLGNQFIQLASLFGRLCVYFIRPKGVQSQAFARICPAVTLECGRPGQQHGVEHALEFLNSCLHLTEISDHPVAPQDIDIFHTVAQVKIRKDISFSFDDANVDFILDKDLERMNFTEIPSGTALGRVLNGAFFPLIAKDEHGKEITEEFFNIHANELHLTRKTMPSMLTLNESVIKQDCFCYLMERLAR